MKKFICILISTFLLFSCFSFTYAEDAALDSESTEAAGEPEQVFIKDLIGAVEGEEDNKTGQLSEQINVLKAVYPEIKLYDDLELEITRAEFLVMLVQLTAGTGYPLYTDFNDVDADNAELLDSLGYAIDMGLVAKADSFRPDDTITYHEMLKMAVVACGYEIAAQHKGGWPSGYFAIAAETGLMDYLEKAVGAVSVKDAYRVLYNVVTASLLEHIPVGSHDEFQINEGYSILNNRLKVRVIEDIVYANQLTSLTRELSGKGDQAITIGTHTFKNVTNKNLLGYNVRAFLLEVGGEDTIISIRKHHNNEVFISEFLGLDGFKIKGIVSDGKKKEYNLYKGYSLLLNDIAAPDVKLADYLERDDVTLRLIDNDDDGRYDVVKIYTWQYMQIGKVDIVNKQITSKDVSTNLLDLSDEDAVYKIYDCVNGEITEISLDDLLKDDVLTYVTSRNLKTTTIFRSNATVSGVYSAKDDDLNIITVDDKDYKLSVYARNNYPYITYGSETTLNLDATGIVVTVSQLDSGYRYGWIVVSGMDGVINSDVTVKIFDQGGSMKILPVAKKVFVDDEPIKENEFYKLEQGLVDNRLVKYGTNANGELNMVDFPSEYSGKLPFAENLPERDSFTQYYSGGYSKTGNGSFGSVFMADSGTIFFSVPTTDRLDDELYLIKSYSSFRNGTVRLTAYDIAPGQGPKVALTFSNSPAPATDVYSAAEVVVNIKNVRNEDDIFVQQVQTYDGSQYKKYFVRDGVDISSVKAGDIIRLSVYNNEIYSFNIDYSYSTNTIDSTLLPGSGQVKNLYYRGYVYGYGNRMVHLWDTMSTSAEIELDKIYGIDFRDQNVIFVDVYKKSDGTVDKVMARYKPISEIKDYLHAGADADFMIARIQEGNYVKKWIYRVID